MNITNQMRQQRPNQTNITCKYVVWQLQMFKAQKQSGQDRTLLIFV